ncbi:MAG: TonB-dependent receptor [Massilia sp.]|nr:TonB-dependent receptor [Massilia sp.]
MQQRLRMKPIYFFVLQALACIGHANAAVLAAAPDALVTDADAANLPQIVEILGQGQSRQVQNISRSDMLKAVPGTSALKSLEKLPGVNFQSADPFGAYEWSTRFSIRGFNQNQLGFTLDHIPLGDMSYGNNNGLHISRAISSENVGRVAVSQGAGAIGTASTSNLGGTVQFVTLDPAQERATTFAQTVGSENSARTFVRFDSGVLDTGTKFYLSATRQRADKFKGSGAQDQDQVNAKFVHAFGDHVLSGFYNYSDRKEVDYQDMSLEMIQRLGANWDNYAPDFARALAAAKGTYSGAVNSLDDAYYEASGLRKDALGALSLDLKLAPTTSLKTSVYHHGNRGQGHWYTPYVKTSDAVPLSIRTTEYSIGRDGIVSDLSWELGQHTLNAGFWGERSLHSLTRNYYAVTDGADTNHFLSGPFRTDFKQQFTTTTTQFYVEDNVSLMDNRLKINAGFKSPKVAIEAVSLVGTRAAGTIVAQKTFLPQIGATFRLSQNDEVFASASQNMRAYQPGVGGPFSQSQATFAAGTPNLKPEMSVTAELGLRFKRDALQGSVALYHADFSDRVLSVATCAGIVGCPSTFVNVGKVETNGLESIAVWKLAREWSWFNAYTFNNSQYKSNYLDGTTTVAITGKQVVDAPRNTFSTELTYENATWFTRVGGKFTDKRYYTYTNDANVPSMWIGALSAGVKLPSFAMLKEVSLQLNVTNLFDKRYVSTIGSNGYQAKDPSGTAQTLLTGAPRQAFLTLSGKL